MDVIRRGTAPENVVWEGLCGRCDSLIEAKRKELDDMGFQCNGNCPVCGYDMTFSKKAVIWNTTS